jgi:hypothetical protein
MREAILRKWIFRKKKYHFKENSRCEFAQKNPAWIAPGAREVNIMTISYRKMQAVSSPFEAACTVPLVEKEE